MKDCLREITVDTKFTDVEKLEVFKTALAIHKEDIMLSSHAGMNLDGMCNNIKEALSKIYKKGCTQHIWVRDSVELFPELAQLKPKDAYLYWWPRGVNNTDRLEAYEKLIKDKEDEINKI